MMITWFSIICFVVLMVLMFWFTVKYRRRPGVPAQPSPHHNTLLEVFWTVVPSSSMLVMFVLGFQGYAAKVVSPDNAMELRIQGFKWAWIATYPNGATSPETQPLSYSKTTVNGAEVVSQGKQYPIFYLPENTDVKLRMQSSDVIHSFWIPEFRVKRDVIPNRYTGYGIKTPKLGKGDTFIHQETGQEMIGRDMWIFCAEYCGDEHSRMAATLRIVPQEIYDQKMEEWGVQLSPVELGEKIYKQICISCHAIDGTKLVGPAWNSHTGENGQYGWGYPATLADGTTAERDANYYRESILAPNVKIVKGYAPAMASYQGQLSDEDLDGLIAYIQTLSDRGPAPAEGDESSEPSESEAGSQAEEAAGSES
jgi:cytochrome c oxidase subunit 2